MTAIRQLKNTARLSWQCAVELSEHVRLGEQTCEVDSPRGEQPDAHVACLSSKDLQHQVNSFKTQLIMLLQGSC